MDPWWLRVRRWLERMREAPREEDLTRLLRRYAAPDGTAIAAVIGKWALRTADVAGLAATRRCIAALVEGAEETAGWKARPTETAGEKAMMGEAYTVPWSTPASVYDEKKAGGRGARTGPGTPNEDERTTLQERLALGQEWNTLVDGLGWHLRDPALVNELKKRGEHVRGDVSQTMLDDLRDMLVQQLYREGQSPQKLAKDIDRIFPRTYWGRAEAIAQTETLMAQGTVQHEAYVRDGVSHHQWVTSFHNSRDSHVAAHGQVQPIDRPFVVGGARLMHPGDASGPANEVIRCHCDALPAFGPNAKIPLTPWLGEGVGEKPQPAWPGKWMAGQVQAPGPIPSVIAPNVQQPQVELAWPGKTAAGSVQAPMTVPAGAGPAKNFWDPAHFRLEGYASVGGAHDKFFYTHIPTGDKYLFKPTREAFRAHGDAVGATVAERMGLYTPKIGVGTFDGKFGSMQEWIPNVNGTFEGLAPEALTTRQVQAVQREHVLDWLIGNHDGHAANFVRLPGGKVAGIDKGQLFKHLGTDELSVDYHPNKVFGAAEPYYNTLYRAARTGKVRLSDRPVMDLIRKVEAIPDEEYLGMLRPYAETRFRDDREGLQRFYDLALERKRNLRQDFRGFLVANRPAAVAPAEQMEWDLARLVEDLPRCGYQGRTIPIDVGSIEDQNVRVWLERGADGKDRLACLLKVRQEADAALVARLGAPSTIAGTRLPEDVFADDLLAAVKSVNYHQADGQYNLATIDKARKHRAALERLKASPSASADVKRMCEQYLATLDEIEEAVSLKKTAGQFAAYAAKADGPVASGAIKAQRSALTVTDRTCTAGQLTVSGETPVSHMYGRITQGNQLEFDLTPNARATYVPHARDNPWALQGELHLSIDRSDSNALQAALQRLDDLGIPARAPTRAERELVYLHQQAFAAKVDLDAGYQGILSELDAQDASTEDRVKRLKTYWQGRLGVDDLDKVASYNPEGHHERGFLTGSDDAGYRHWYRFDIDPRIWDRQRGGMKGYGLHTEITGGKSLQEFIEQVLDNNGLVAPTTERLRLGIRGGSMSPEADMLTGGANYAFTRIKGPSEYRPIGIEYKARLLGRTDCISYAGDEFGSTKPDRIGRRAAGVEDWKQHAKHHSNEACFKNGFTFLDNLQTIHCTASQRAGIIEAFKRRGITALPDGRLIEDVVVVR